MADEAKKEEKKPKKISSKGKIERKPKKPVENWKKYEAVGETLKRKNASCPKCGPGTFLAAHKDRSTCGKCGYSEMIASKSGDKDSKKEVKKPSKPTKETKE